TPDNHFAASPHCSVTASGRRRVGGSGSSPTVCARIVSPAGVQSVAVIATPDDHFTARPDCRVKLPAVRRIRNARWSPGVIGADTGGSRYFGKRIFNTRRCRYFVRTVVSCPLLAKLSVVVRQPCYQTLRQHRSGQALSNNKWIVTES